MKRFSQLTPTLLILIALLGAAGLGYWLFSQVSLTDPAALVRKKYAASQVTASGSQPDNSPPPAEKSTTSKATANDLQVQSSSPGEIVSALPTEIAEAHRGETPEPKPVIEVPSLPGAASYHPSIPPISRLTLNLPPVPQRLLDQTPPESNPLTPETPFSTSIRVAPRHYLFNNLAAGAISGKTVPVKPSDQTDFNPETFAPLGEDLTLALMNNVASNSFEVPVAAAVWDPLYFQGHLLLRIGDKVVGSAQAGKNRDRILVNFNRIILKDGRSLPIQATALETDGTIGIHGLTIGENLLRTLTPVLLEAVRGFSEVLQERTETTSTTFLGATTQTTVGNDLQSKGVEAGQGALEKISEIISQDLEENRPYILALAGTRFRARLLQPLDVSQADYGK